MPAIPPSAVPVPPDAPARPLYESRSPAGAAERVGRDVRWRLHAFRQLYAAIAVLQWQPPAAGGRA